MGEIFTPTPSIISFAYGVELFMISVIGFQYVNFSHDSRVTSVFLKLQNVLYRECAHEMRGLVVSRQTLSGEFVK